MQEMLYDASFASLVMMRKEEPGDNHNPGHS